MLYFWIQNDESTLEDLNKTTRSILDPTEELYNNREEIPKFVEEELTLSMLSSKTPQRKRSINNTSKVMNKSTAYTSNINKGSAAHNEVDTHAASNNTSHLASTTSYTPKAAGSIHDVLSRSMSVLSKVNSKKQINK